jgi:hypothetical protein
MTPKPWENKSGCKDPTAYAVEKAICEDEQRKDELIWAIKKIIKWAGFELLNRIELRDRKSGRVFR